METSGSINLNVLSTEIDASLPAVILSRTSRHWAPVGGSPLRTLSGPVGQLAEDPSGGTGSPRLLTTPKAQSSSSPRPSCPELRLSPSAGPGPSPTTSSPSAGPPGKWSTQTLGKKQLSCLLRARCLSCGQCVLQPRVRHKFNAGAESPAGKCAAAAVRGAAPGTRPWQVLEQWGPGPLASRAADALLGHPAAGSCVWGLLARMANGGSAWPGWAVRPSLRPRLGLGGPLSSGPGPVTQGPDRGACPGVWGRVAVPDGRGGAEGAVIRTPSISPEQPLCRMTVIVARS